MEVVRFRTIAQSLRGAVEGGTVSLNNSSDALVSIGKTNSKATDIFNLIADEFTATLRSSVETLSHAETAVADATADSEQQHPKGDAAIDSTVAVAEATSLGPLNDSSASTSFLPSANALYLAGILEPIDAHVRAVSQLAEAEETIVLGKRRSEKRVATYTDAKGKLESKLVTLKSEFSVSEVARN